MNTKINITYDVLSLQRYWISSTIRKSIAVALTAEGITTPCEINVMITNNHGIQAINAAMRQIDAPTDVLSFPMFQLEPGNPPKDWDVYLDPETNLCPLGDMVISLERTVAQAKEIGHSTLREISYLTIHSVLHLLGYDHLDEGPQKATMRAREKAIISALHGISEE